ncbi:hypothetical protein EPC71_05705 [Helicobacter pylori]|nr:hypothetical protein EPC71_05705 [Helicobacter pylori]
MKKTAYFFCHGFHAFFVGFPESFVKYLVLVRWHFLMDRFLRWFVFNGGWFVYGIALKTLIETTSRFNH